MRQLLSKKQGSHDEQERRHEGQNTMPERTILVPGEKIMNVSAGSHLKHLRTVKSELEKQLREAQRSQQEAAEDIRRIRGQMAESDKQIKQLTETVVVSEHAMLRYFERVLKFDLAEIQGKIMPKAIREQVGILNNGTFPVGHGVTAFRVCVKNRVAVTVLGHDHEKE